jgi:hypothetical protein
LEAVFVAEANPQEMVLSLTQREVKGRCALHINGKRIAQLKRSGGGKTFYYPIPPMSLTNGQNVVSIVPADLKERTVLGELALHERTLREVLKLQPVSLRVVDSGSGLAVPARVTIVDTKEQRVEIFNADTNQTAVRQGVVYSLGKGTTFELPEGKYIVYATRGMEWSRDRQPLEVGRNKPAQLQMRIVREVDTAGFVAADTHIHNVTFSGHGDASIDERMLTLAGEGVEMAVSTDHNHNTDYRPYQEKICAGEYFTPVTGNEVTTGVGHMNGFPLKAGDAVPNHKLNDWVALVEGIKAKGAQVVILNHPRWPSIPKSPFTQFGLNRASGDFTNGTQFPFDGMELANALTPEPDPLYLFKDWFALLNWGNRITAIGSSDSHTVDEPVGQGRSYVPSQSDDPTRVDVADACKRFLAGETSVALGIFSDVRVDERYRMGQTNSLREPSIRVALRVAAAGWIRPRRAILFLNGQAVKEMPVASRAGRPTDEWLKFSVKRPSHDAHLVCVVIGDGASHPSWQTKEKFTLAATNPVYIDGDGDGRYEPPRQTARQRLAATGGMLDRQWEAVMKADEVIAVQMLSLMSQNHSEGDLVELEKRVREASRQRPLFAEFVRPGAEVIRIRKL